MSDQTIEITPENVAFYYVHFCKQNNIIVNEAKIDNYVERMWQSRIIDKVKEEYKNFLLEQATNLTINK